MSPTSSRPGRRTGLLRQLAGAVRLTLRPGGPGLGDRCRALPRLVRATLAGRYHGVTPGHLGLLALALAYVVSPVDLLPEGLLPLVGLADDAVVVAWLAAALVHDTEDFLTWERSAAGATSSPGAGRREDAPGPRDRYGRPQDAPHGAHEQDGDRWDATVEGHVVR